ncbi:MAG: hypothetical protein PHX62_01605 [Bacilli bacterium]|nr:hypothetical protein [Bacilli bacterium]
MNNYSQSINEIYENYIKARNSVGILCISHLGKYLVSGPESLKLISSCSTSTIDANNGSFYTLFFRKKKYIAEVLVLRLSLNRYLVIGSPINKIVKLLKKARRKYRSAFISDCTKEYCLYSFHGNHTHDFFQGLDYRYIYRTKRQNYNYYHLLSPRKDEFLIFQHFCNLNFIPINLEVEKLFMYNNNVILNIENIPRSYRLSVCNELYPFSKQKIKTKAIKIRKYELDRNFLVTNRHKIYNHYGKKIGIIHCTYRIPYKRNPYLIAFVRKANLKHASVIKFGKNEALIKPIFNY